MKFAYDTNVGQVRQVNQDRACVLQNSNEEIFAVVCDGMGGHQAGELASTMAIESLCQSFFEASPLLNETIALNWLNDATKQANKEIFDDANSNRFHKGMGTTLACCLVLKDVIIIGHVGDSRVYVFEDQELKQLTKDHTYVNLLVDSGTITKEQAKNHPKKNILMKALGVFEDVSPTTLTIENKHQKFVVCSDGLYNALSDDEIVDILNQKGPLAQKVLDLIQKANANGGPDNISVVLLDGGEC